MEIDEWVGVYGEATKGAGERERAQHISDALGANRR